MYLRQPSDLWGSSTLSNGEVGSFLAKPQTEVWVAPERYQKFGYAPATTANLGNATLVDGPPSEVSLFDGTIDGEEIEVYGFNLVAGQTYLFSAYGSGGTPLADPVLYLIDAGLTTILDADDDGGAGVNSLYTFTPTTTGTYYIGVGAFPDSGLTGGYTLDAVLSPGVDTVGDAFDPTAPDLNMNGITYGFVEAGPSPYGPGFSEVDTYELHVEAGKFYTIQVAGGADYASDPFDLPPGELDTVIRLFDSNGVQLKLNDDISFPTDVSSAISFLATSDTTYYLDVYSYAPYTGGYSITTQEIDPADYADENPLDAINWFSAANVPFDETNTAYVYFAAPGETFGETADDGVSPIPSFGWNDTEKAAVMLALQQYENVLGTNYEITTDVNQATFRLITTTSTQYGAYMYPQDPAYGDAMGISAYNVNSGGWDKAGFSTQNLPGNQVSLLQGGFSFETILHEMGHGHGLAHPHDHGGGSDIMLGVIAAQDSYGFFDLNQAVYTVMSYNASWETGPNGPSPFTINGIDDGWQGTLSAFDIAALQQRYGANTTFANGNDTYVLKDTQTPGTFYSTIWDTGGKDEIKYTGNRNARIDLTSATLDYSATGGGVMSFVTGIFGGFTIAAGVVIEDATGGSGNDGILGNAAVNTLKGNDGNDTLVGRAGGDSLQGGAGFDTASYIDAGSAVRVSLATNSGTAGDARNDSLSGIEALTGSAHNDTLEGDQFNNTLQGGGGNDTLTAGQGNDTVDGGDGNDQIFGGGGNDTITGGAGNDTAYGDAGNDSMAGGAGNDTLSGEEGNDTLAGDAGNDTLRGGTGNDVMTGGADNDTLQGNGGADRFVFGSHDGKDDVLDFAKGQDLIDLTGTSLVWGDLDSNGNAKLDDGDAFVSVSGTHTVIDLGAADGGAAGVDTVSLDVNNLKNENFLF